MLSEFVESLLRAENTTDIDDNRNILKDLKCDNLKQFKLYRRLYLHQEVVTHTHIIMIWIWLSMINMIKFEYTRKFEYLFWRKTVHCIIILTENSKVNEK